MTKQLDHETEPALTDFYNAVGDALNALMAKVDARARSEEREACAKVCEELRHIEGRFVANRFASEVRARASVQPKDAL